MKYGKGWKPDIAREYRHTLAAPAPGAVPSTWTRLMTPVGDPTIAMPTRQRVLDQSITSACVAEALARAMHAFLLNLGVPAPYPAIRGIYDMARRWSTPANQPITDSGCYPYDAISATAAWGVIREAEAPFDPGAINTELNLDEVQEAAEYRISGWRRIETTDDARVREMMAHIAAGHPIVFGLDTDKAFEDYRGGVYERDFANASLGGHMLCALGYATLRDGTVAFWVVNSWSDRWGESGWVRIGSRTMGGACVNDVYAITSAPVLKEAA